LPKACAPPARSCDGARRGHGEGSVYRETRTYETKGGPVVSTSWVATVEDERDPATGTRRQIELRAKTKATALAKANEHRKRLDAGIREQPRLTVEQFLTEWLTVVRPARVGGSTVENYSSAINGHLIPAWAATSFGISLLSTWTVS
jgi:hypothetical protein